MEGFGNLFFISGNSLETISLERQSTVPLNKTFPSPPNFDLNLTDHEFHHEDHDRVHGTGKVDYLIINFQFFVRIVGVIEGSL